MATTRIGGLLVLLVVAGAGLTAAGAVLTAPADGGLKKTALGAALLSDMYLSVGELDPAFDPTVFYYTASLNSSVSEVEIYVEAPPEEVSAGCGLSVNGSWVDSGEYSPSLALRSAGTTTTISIYVLAIGFTPTTYTVYLAREKAKGSSGGGLSWWEILLIVIACILVVALIAYLVYWLLQHGYLDWIPGVANRRSAAGGDYHSIA